MNVIKILTYEMFTICFNFLHFRLHQVGPANQTLPLNTLAVLPCEASGEWLIKLEKQHRVKWARWSWVQHLNVTEVVSHYQLSQGCAMAGLTWKLNRRVLSGIFNKLFLIFKTNLLLHFSGSPTPSVSWMKNDESISSVQYDPRITINITGSLRIESK